MKNKNSVFYMFALAAYGKGVSGGDRIFIEFARRWSKEYPVTIYIWEEGHQMCRRQHLESSNIKYQISKLERWCKPGFLICYIARIIEGIRLGLTLNLSTNYYLPSTIIYSSSEFWMDSLPAFILKLRNPNVKWVATWFQTAPNPLRGYTEQSGKNIEHRENKYKFSAFLYWLAQLPIKPLIKKYADYVLVNNEDEKKQFPDLNKKGKVIVVLGAVPLESINKYLTTNYQLLSTKKYDAVFQGRFHPQKGVVELIDIWKKVVEKLPDAKLAMIGDGPLMGNVKAQISKLKLEKNIKLFGYVFDGHKKYSIFAKSKIVVHPAFYDSGGMASAEAMAFGLPVIGFDLKSYESYYPKGMEKVEIGNLDKFAKKIIYLIKIQLKRKKLGREARELVQGQLSWEKRASEVLSAIM